MDTYLVVILAVMEINNCNCEVSESNLVTEIHQTIILMHSQNLVTQLHSCLKETIQTALSRYVKLDYLVKKTHTN